MNLSSRKLRIAFLFGGRSSEHDVSILSATNIMSALSPTKYDAIPIYVTREGQWLLSRFEDGTLTRPSSGTEVCLVPGGYGKMLAISSDSEISCMGKIDIMFPVLHGLYGEDGSVQGLAEVARVPYVGCGILGSAAALDKDIAKQLLKAAGLPVARSITIYEGMVHTLATFERELGLPFFIKPARQGSSIGVSKVTSNQEFERALVEAFRHDRKLLAEEFICGREIEYSVLEDTSGQLQVSRPGEIATAEDHSFYSYDAKYLDENGAKLMVPAELPSVIEQEMRDMAASAFRAVGCEGMARVDFFLTADMKPLINEINTIPGFTDISMYSKALEASGLSYSEIINRLIEHGLSRSGVL